MTLNVAVQLLTVKVGCYDTTTLNQNDPEVTMVDVSHRRLEQSPRNSDWSTFSFVAGSMARIWVRLHTRPAVWGGRTLFL